METNHLQGEEIQKLKKEMEDYERKLNSCGAENIKLSTSYNQLKCLYEGLQESETASENFWQNILNEERNERMKIEEKLVAVQKEKRELEKKLGEVDLQLSILQEKIGHSRENLQLPDGAKEGGRSRKKKNKDPKRSLSGADTSPTRPITRSQSKSSVLGPLESARNFASHLIKTHADPTSYPESSTEPNHLVKFLLLNNI